MAVTRLQNLTLKGVSTVVIFCGFCLDVQSLSFSIIDLRCNFLLGNPSGHIFGVESVNNEINRG